MEEILKLSLIGVFVHFMINYAPILAFIRNPFFSWLDINGGRKNTLGYFCRKTKYLLGCIFCITFWLTLIIDYKNCLYTPVIAAILNGMFLNSFFKKANA
jgi:hypothetical protein